MRWDAITGHPVGVQERFVIRKISAELLPLTHELAKKIATMPSLPGERDKKPSRIKFFQAHIKEGTFGSPTWSIAVVKDSQETREFRADGQHTASTLAELTKEEFPKDLKVTLQKFEIDSIREDGAGLFNMFDNPQSARSNTDVMGVYRAHFDDLQALSAPFLVKVAHGIDFYIRDLPLTERPAQLPSRQHGLFWEEEEYRRFALWLSTWREAKYSFMISKPGLVAEMLADWKGDEDIATEFWGYVLTVSHPDVNHDTRELAETIKEWSSKSKYRQDKFRSRAKKVFERYRKDAKAASLGVQ
jgi:hypothetical protein